MGNAIARFSSFDGPPQLDLVDSRLPLALDNQLRLVLVFRTRTNAISIGSDGTSSWGNFMLLAFGSSPLRLF